MNTTEALRQCIEAMKLVDFKDCAESAELWHKFNLAQANAERVLRDGEKQEPFGYVAVQAGYDTGTVFNTSRVVSKETAEACAKQWRPQNRDYRVEVFPVYRHPAPSLQTVKPLIGKPWPEHDGGSQLRWVTPDGVVHGRPSVTDMLEYSENCLKADLADGYDGYVSDVRMGRIPTLRSLFDRTAPQPAAAPLDENELVYALRNICDYRTDVDDTIAARSMRFYAEMALEGKPAAAPSGDVVMPMKPTDEILRRLLAVRWPASYRDYLRHPHSGPHGKKREEEEIAEAEKQYEAIRAAITATKE